MARWGAPLTVCLVALLSALCSALVRAADANFSRGEFTAIVYRSVEDRDPDQRFGALETAKLAEEFDWLRAHGYQPVSVDDLMAASRGTPLPPKAVLLTFDDGWEDFYTRVFPLLEAFHYPALVGVVAPWVAAAPGANVVYGNTDVARERFMTREQIQEISRSGLVEIAAQARERAPGSEDGAAYLQQTRQDFAAASDLVLQETGRSARVLVWPRGEGTEQAAFLATSLGFVTVLTSEPGRGMVSRLERIPRRAVEGDPGMGEFIDHVLRPPSVSSQPPQPATAR